MAYYAVDVFCGAGGMSEGILQAGFHILFSNDVNASVQETYTNRHEQLGYIEGFNTTFELDTIENITGDLIRDRIANLTFFENEGVPEIDVIFGGPPCQGFSLAGRRNADDPRNLLFGQYLRVISEVNPKYVVMENVVGFLSTQLTNFVGINDTYERALAPEILTRELEALGYNVAEPRVLEASDFGVPQNRRRAIFIASRNDVVMAQYPEPQMGQRVSVREAIGDLVLDDNIRNELEFNRDYLNASINGRTPVFRENGEGEVETIAVEELINLELTIHAPLIVERFSLYQEGESTAMLRNRIRTNGIDINGKTTLINMLCEQFEIASEEVIELFATGTCSEDMINLVLTKKNMRRRLNGNEQAPTVVSLPDDFISPFENRIFSVREMARLQSFDDSFVFLGPRTTGGARRRVEVPQYTQVGNAVPPLLARAVALEVREALDETREMQRDRR